MKDCNPGNDSSMAIANLVKLRVDGLISLRASLITACCVPHKTVVKLSKRRETGRDGVETDDNSDEDEDEGLVSLLTSPFFCFDCVVLVCCFDTVTCT